MKISELARRTGLSVATVKYYLREGLLPGGARSAPNQAAYGEEHVRRLGLIRTLRTVGGLEIEHVRRVVTAIEDPALTRHEVFGVVERAGDGRPTRRAETGAFDEQARTDVDRFIERLGWRVRPDAGARQELADALGALRRLGRSYEADVFGPYAAAADRMAAWEVASLDESAPPSVAVERMVIGTVVFGAVFDALRRLAHEHHSAGDRLDDTGPGRHVVAWRYRVDAEHREAFERAYGPDGPLVRLYATAPGFVETELVRGDDGDYLMVERWDSAEHHRSFRSERRAEYEALDAGSGRLTEPTMVFAGATVAR